MAIGIGSLRHRSQGRRLAPWRLPRLQQQVSFLALALLAGLAFCPPGPAMAASCPERPRCEGCGCKGGPGYRGPDNKCVGFKNLEKVCGPFPHEKCTFENAPGTGANKECALRDAPRRKTAKKLTS